jgi:hypothetical protein
MNLHISPVMMGSCEGPVGWSAECIITSGKCSQHKVVTENRYKI